MLVNHHLMMEIKVYLWLKLRETVSNVCKIVAFFPFFFFFYPLMSNRAERQSSHYTLQTLIVQASITPTVVKGPEPLFT